MSPRTQRIAQIGYIAVVLASLLTFKVYHSEIHAAFLEAGGLDGLAPLMTKAMGAFALFIACALSIFLSIPIGPLFYIAFGFFYGPFDGTLLASLANTVGSAAAFYVFRPVTPTSAALQRAGIKNVFLTLVLLRSSPWVPNPLITLFCAAIDISMSTFVLTTFIGTMPLIAVYAIAASRSHGHFESTDLYSTDIAIAFGLLSAISVVGFLTPVRIALDLLATMKIESLKKKRAASTSAPIKHPL
jgi:uncharacterized membrane protein YdjX (TVP38/TMEM64 family)